ncbi:RNA-binding domain-containing protein [Zopfia rhizophila CBS 207.26]|uniref:RNA-binding domain-containing protein n=1 Tax=Zopfia rhizophila CBS 207.26 TaxID=1314779 RepID=A0A6A6E2B6_9PEZI|nr:RNA-binding domain-containing protein [Zopfia rhizophila CBS 207.26]
MASNAKEALSKVKAYPPNRTLYCKNLPDKLKKDDLKRNLYMLFATYGVVLDIVALKTPKMRGQAHIVFRDIDSSTQALRALQGFDFFGKEMQLAYAKGKSDTIAKLDGTYKLPTKDQPEPSAEMTSVQQAVFGGGPSKSAAKPTQGQQDGQKGVKRGREEESDEDVAMDEDDDDAAMDVSDSE